MNKGLEALEKICNKGCDYCDAWHYENKLYCKHELGGCTKCVFCGEEHDIIEKELKAVEIIKENIDFSLEFDESQNEWALWIIYISNEKHCALIAKGSGIKTYDLLKEVLL